MTDQGGRRLALLGLALGLVCSSLLDPAAASETRPTFELEWAAVITSRCRLDHQPVQTTSEEPGHLSVSVGGGRGAIAETFSLASIGSNLDVLCGWDGTILRSVKVWPGRPFPHRYIARHAPGYRLVGSVMHVSTDSLAVGSESGEALLMAMPGRAPRLSVVEPDCRLVDLRIAGPDALMLWIARSGHGEVIESSATGRRLVRMCGADGLLSAREDGEVVCLERGPDGVTIMEGANRYYFEHGSRLEAASSVRDGKVLLGFRDGVVLLLRLAPRPIVLSSIKFEGVGPVLACELSADGSRASVMTCTAVALQLVLRDPDLAR